MATNQTFIVTALVTNWGTKTMRVEATSHADAIALTGLDAAKCKPWGQPTPYTLGEWKAKLAADGVAFGGLSRMSEGGGDSIADEDDE